MSTPMIQTGMAGLVVGPLEARTAAPLNVVGEIGLIKVSGADTNGGFALVHFTAPPMSGPPLHMHTREDEMFYVLEGELVFEVDGARIVAPAGTTVYAPRETVHTFQNFTQQNVRFLVLITPAGIERFFEQLSQGTAPGQLPDPVFYEAVQSEFGLRTMGPPLGF